MIRILFGGSFDPLHLGHIAVADAIQAQWSPNEFLWIPAACSPHKLANRPVARGIRQAMLESVIMSRPREEICFLELERLGPSFTCDTLKELDCGLGDDQTFLVIGGDSLEGLSRWKNLSAICEQVDWLIAPRFGWLEGSENRFLRNVSEDVGDKFRFHWLNMSPVDISSRDVRRLIATGQESAKDFFPSKVWDIISLNNLYQS